MAREDDSVLSAYWWTESSLPVENIPADLFTHLYCAFADLDPETCQVVIPDSKIKQISTFSRTVKQNAPDVKTLLSIGVRDGEDRETFPDVVSKGNRPSFIKSSIALAREYDFDGLDLHWLCPSSGLEMINLGHLLNEWRDAAEKEFLLVLTVYYLPKPRSLPYPIQDMINSLSWINVQAYDFYTPQPSPFKTGPAHPFLDPNKPSSQLYGQLGLAQWLDAGFPPQKIVLGLPFYGWAWQLQNPEKTGVFAPADGPALRASPNGRIDYRDIRKFIPDFPKPSIYLEDYIASYCHDNGIWFAYDDAISIKAKIPKAREVLKYLLRGYYAWHIGGDDENYTLATAARNAWK